MAIYHFSAKIISRGKGQSAVAAAAYRSGERLRDEQTGELKLYDQRAARIRLTDIMAPKDAPDWVHDRNRLWNEAERAEKRKDAQLAREIEVSLPHELTAQQREWLVRDFAREAFVRKGFAVDLAIHAPDRGDPRNHHAHLMVTRRALGAEGFAKTKDWQFDRKQLEAWREQWAQLANRHLERHGHEARIDHRSLEAQGAGREATVHVGYAGSEMAARGAASDRMDALTEILERNELRIELTLIDGDLAELASLHDTERQAGAAASRRPRTIGMEPELPTAAQLQQQAEREAQALRELQRQAEQAKAATLQQQQKDVLDRAQAFERAKAQEAEEARKTKEAHEAAEAVRAREGEISSSSARYAIALGSTYDVRDPYASLARAAMQESSLFHQNQERMRVAMARERDPDKRQVIELRRQIEGCEYMAVTSDRLAGIGLAITGQLHSPQATADRERAAGYRALAAELRAERNVLLKAIQTREQEAKAPPQEVRSQPAAPQHPAARAAPDPARDAGVPPPAPERAGTPPLRRQDLKTEQATPSAPQPVRPSATPAQPAPIPDRVAAPEPTRKAEMTGTWRPGAAPRAADQTSARSGTPDAMEIRVADGSQRPPVRLDAFMRDHPRIDPAPQRPAGARAFTADPQARKAQQLARFDDLQRSQEAARAIERIGQSLAKGDTVEGKDLKSLTREQWDRVGRKGSEGLRELVKENQQTHSQGRGERTRDP